MDARTAFWWRWLMAVTGFVLLFGLALVLLPGVMQRVFAVLYSVEALSDRAVSYAAFISGVLGAVMAGWAVAFGLVLAGPFRRLEPVAWDTIAASLAVWFALDTPFSIATGYWQNVVFINGPVLLLFAVPLGATYRCLHPKRTEHPT